MARADLVFAVIALAAVNLTSAASFIRPREFTCPGLGIFSDPDDCSGFYMCGPGNGDVPSHTHFMCPDSFLFDETVNVCNYEDQVDCGSRPRPGTTTTTKTSTTQEPITTTTTTPFTTTTITTTPPTTTTSECDTKPPTTTPETTTTTTTLVTETVTTTPTTTTTQVTETVTTTTMPTTTTTHHFTGDRFPKKVIGLYLTLADDTEDGFHTDAEWEPRLFEYQQTGANVLFFTFVNPETMVVPTSFQKLAATRGTDVDGAVPKDTKIIFAIGGYAYSLIYNPWHWLTSKEAAEAMAEEVATWPSKYGCDGIDLDIEEGAGSRPEAGGYMADFLRRLRQLQPDIIIGQPAYGFPQVQAETDIVNYSWNVDGTSNNLADSVGLMVYEGTEALRYVDNYAKGSEQWEGFPIKVNVPYGAILLGCKGVTSPSAIQKLAEEAVRQDLLGIMVWFASVRDGLHYEISWDASTSLESQAAYVSAMELFRDHMSKQ